MAGKGSEVRTSDRVRQDIEEGKEHLSDLQGETDETDFAEQREEDDLNATHPFLEFISKLHLSSSCSREAIVYSTALSLRKRSSRRR